MYADTLFQDVYRGIIYNDSTWSADGFSLSVLENAVNENPGGIETSGTDLSAFYKRGGKLLSYQGGYDQAAPFALNMWYFSQVRSTLNLSLSEMQSFYRLIYINGMVSVHLHQACAANLPYPSFYMFKLFWVA